MNSNKEKHTIRKSTRTISGVTPIAVMTEPLGCPGECIYCPTFSATPQSYTPDSPAVIRARACRYDATEQVRLRLKILTQMGHPTDKIELIIMGGTFLAAPLDYQYEFIKGCYEAMNGAEATTLAEAKAVNETAACRCTGLCIETRPDWCGEEEIARMLEFGATRVELGVQMLDDEIYTLVKRGHTVADVATASRLLREVGLKVHYHWMPGLPGSTPEKDLALSKMLFADSRFRPDGLKIYPTMVVDGTVLQQWHKEGRYQPYPAEVMINLVADIKALVPPYVRISRVLRDIPAQFITGGLRDSMRDIVKERMKQSGIACRCIRCREYGHRLRDGAHPSQSHLVRLEYEAGEGKEIFLSAEDDNGTLFGLLRLRIQQQHLPGITGDSAIIRELHVYGAEVPLKQQHNAAAQHRGLGKELLVEAERIAREEFHLPQIAVLSGVGAREYYRTEAGYSKQGHYMIKPLVG